MSNHKILIVDDDDEILRLLSQFFLKNGYQACTANSGEQAINLIKQDNFDLVILDIMMPRITGIELAQQIKHENKIPIILLTALSSIDDRIKGLKSGVDDYIIKPFEPEELLLRAKKLIEIYFYYKRKVINIGDNLSYNLDTKELIKDNTLHFLSSTQQKLLELFIEHQGKVLSREKLSAFMGGLSERSIDVQVVRLRNKIGDNKKQKYLKTIRHIGYALYL